MMCPGMTIITRKMAAKIRISKLRYEASIPVVPESYFR